MAVLSLFYDEIYKHIYMYNPQASGNIHTIFIVVMNVRNLKLVITMLSPAFVIWILQMVR